MSHDSRIALLWTGGITLGMLALAAVAWQLGLFDLSTGLVGSAG